ncbi:RhoGEF domain protein [Rhizoctonia solani AG-3 Rhs1AP]|uniref:RhoGEF domain protein n=1 Tax=Rhizoctonia solani AG-3 Rhs1AP TaxID=1086054 RepID=X8JBR6_9AGAM|nr:RhoGEF domain protein [Rhizoctonia solani AG-3 Rhs1AP]
MRRGSGYIGTTQRHGELEDNDASDYSQDEDVRLASSRHDRTGYPGTYTSTSMYTRSTSSRDKPSGIPRPGSQNSRPPSVTKAPRSRPYISSSSADSSTTNETVPPMPQIPHTRARSGTPRTSHDSHNIPTNYAHNQPQSGLSRRASSVSRPRSRTHSKSGYVDAEDPPPLPSSDSDSTRAIEQTPKRASWAKDRRRFANTTPTSTTCDSKDREPQLLAVGEGGSRHDQPPTFVAAGRRSSLKPPSNFRNSITPTTAPAPSRIPSTSAKPAREDIKNRTSLERDTGSRNSARTKSSAGVHSTEDVKTPQVYSRREPSQTRASHASRTTDKLRSESGKQVPAGLSSGSGATAQPSNRLSPIHPKVASDEAKGEREQGIISSRHDAQLPVSPFAQSNAANGNCTPRQDVIKEVKQPETISSPVETMLIGAAPTPQANKPPNSRRMSTPIRPTRESSVYVPPTPVTSSALGNRRLSEPSPNKATPSTKAQSPTEQEPHPTILQRLVRRASLSTSKSPKITSTPKSPKVSTTLKSRLDIDHDVEEAPFDLELETPRATINKSGSKSVAPSMHQDSSDRQRNRQSSIVQPTAYLGPTGDELRKPRTKLVEEVSGNNAERLGSPFMGDGSPRFGIDERFRSPKQRATSGLRYDVFEQNDDRSQELFDYYGHGIVEPVNTANYYIEELPIGTVLSSPGRTPVDQTPKATMPPSPMIQSKKRSQYQYTSRTRPSAAGSGAKQKGPGDSTKAWIDDSDSCTPAARPRPRGSSFIPPPIITRTSVTSLDTSTRSEFSDASDQESDDQYYLGADVHQEEAGSAKDYSGRKSPTLVRFASQITQKEFDQEASLTENSSSPQTSRGQPKPGAPSLKATIGQYGNRSSQLPVPRQRKTNSALFRALEQPYDSSPSTTVASLGSSSITEELNSLDEAKASSDYALTEASMEGLHAVSSISSSLDGNGVGDIRWSGAQELSGAAEALFHNIERSYSGDVQPTVMDSSNETQSDIIDSSSYGVSQNGDYSSRRGAPLRYSPGYQDDYGKRRMSMQDKRKAIHESWRTSLEDDQLQRLEETYDPLELHRQELIWEFHESEKEFVDTLRIMVHLFVRPLRTQGQRHWIAGLSPDIMRLLDWLDDIANLHEQLLDALETMRQDHEQVIILFSETIQPFIPLMELYQPYIIRMEETSKQIDSMVLDPQSDFGEFVRMQSALPECELGLEETIRRPVSRLREYVPFFQTLLTLTPRAHPDHLPCFSLLHSMHAMVCVLDEVKAREDEYELIKNLLSRVNGLPPQFTAATRENRLLAQGPLTRVYFHEDGQPRGKGNSSSRSSARGEPVLARVHSQRQARPPQNQRLRIPQFRHPALVLKTPRPSIVCAPTRVPLFHMKAVETTNRGVLLLVQGYLDCALGPRALIRRKKWRYMHWFLLIISY